MEHALAIPDLLLIRSPRFQLVDVLPEPQNMRNMKSLPHILLLSLIGLLRATCL
jgi:hypothetical protein